MPEELSIIGFDDIQAAAFVEPPLTTMAQDFKEMGKLAGEVLLQTMQQDLQIIEDIQVPVTLMKEKPFLLFQNEPKEERGTKITLDFCSTLKIINGGNRSKSFEISRNSPKLKNNFRKFLLISRS